MIEFINKWVEETNCPYRRIPNYKCERNEGNQKLPFKPHSSNCCRQDPLRNVKSSGWNFKEKQDRSGYRPPCPCWAHLHPSISTGAHLYLCNAHTHLHPNQQSLNAHACTTYACTCEHCKCAHTDISTPGTHANNFTHAGMHTVHTHVHVGMHTR